MKFMIASFLVATVASAAAIAETPVYVGYAPAEPEVFPYNLTERAVGPADLEKRTTSPVCQTSSNSPDNGDIQSCINYLNRLGDGTRCQISAQQPQNGDVQHYCGAGTAILASNLLTKGEDLRVCGAGAPLYIGCARLANYFQGLLNTCNYNGKAGGYQYLNGYDINGCYGYNHNDNTAVVYLLRQ